MKKIRLLMLFVMQKNLRKTYKTALYIKPKKLGKFLNKLEEQGFDGFQVFGRDEEVRMFGEQ